MISANPYSNGIRKIYPDIYCHKHPARVSNFLERLDDVKEKAPDGIGIGEILSLTHNREDLDEAQLRAIKNKLEPPQKYTWDDYALVDYGTHPGPNPVEQCKQEFSKVFYYINSLSQSPIPNLAFPYDPLMGKMGKLKQKLLIHCGAGMGRTGSVLIGVICLRDGILFEEGFRKLQGYSPYLRPDTSTQRQAINELFSSR